MDASALRALLIEWANLNSGSPNTDGLARMRAALRRAFAMLPGVLIEELPLAGTDARVLRIRQRPRAAIQVLLSGHYDTVYDANDPFQACEQIDTDTLRGPGVVDMKGGIVVMLAALHEFEAIPAAAEVGWEALLTPDEETGSVGSRPVLEAAAHAHQLGLIFEPGRENGDLVESRKGTGIFTVTCHGRAAHAGRSTDGRNAIAALAEFLVVAHRLPDAMPGVLLNIGAVRGGGTVNIVPEFAQAELNVRITRAADASPVIEQLHALAAPINAREGYRLELSGQFNRMPVEPDPVVAALFAEWQRCGAETGAAPFSWTHVGGGSDGNLLHAAGLPCLDGLGVVGGRMHSSEEYVHLPSLVERSKIAALFLAKLARGEVVLPARAR